MSISIPVAAPVAVAFALTLLAGCGGDDTDASDGNVPPVDGVGAVDGGGGEGGADADSPLATVPSPGAPGDSDPEAIPDAAGTDNGPEGQAPVGTGQDTSAIAGVWDYTRTVPEGTDVAFFEISDAGVVAEYDYRGDDVGDGTDCYATFVASIASNGDDRYDVQDASSLPGADSIDDVRISLEAGSIVFRYLGDAFDPEFGEGMAGITEMYPAAGVSPADLTICD